LPIAFLSLCTTHALQTNSPFEAGKQISAKFWQLNV